MSDQARNWHSYRHSGLTVRSQLELPEWEAFAAEGQTKADVTIRLGESYDQAIHEALPYGGRRRIQFSVADIGVWEISDGNTITLDAASGADERALRLFTLGSAWGAIGYQRGLAMLHGSAVQLDKGAVLFGGAQEQGKSTMAAAMLARGAKLVSDDLARVDPGEGQARIHPSSSRLKLWQEAIDQFGWKDRVLTRDLFREEKFHCVVEATAGNLPIELSAIILLEWGDELRLDALTGGDAVREVLRHTCYRPGMLEVMGRSSEQAALISKIGSATSVFRLTRTRDFTRLNKACELLETL